MGVDEVLTTPRAPWQNPFVERVIGSLRRECFDHVIVWLPEFATYDDPTAHAAPFGVLPYAEYGKPVWNERSLRRPLRQYVAYYHGWRTHLSLDKDAPDRRVTQPATCGRIVEVPHVGGLHHHYERRAA